MSNLENPFRKPILPPEQTDPEANAVLADTLLGKVYGDALRSLDGDTKPHTSKPDDMVDMSLNTEEMGMAEKSKEISLMEAELIMGKENFFGPKAIQKTFGFIPDTIPPISFSKEEIGRAKELGQILVLQVDKLEDETLLTGDVFQKRFKMSEANVEEKYKNEFFFTQETPRVGWALVTPSTLKSNTLCFLDSEVGSTIIPYLNDQVFENGVLPDVYAEALEEFERERSKLNDYDNLSKFERYGVLAGLKIIELTQNSFVEILYQRKVVESAQGACTYIWEKPKPGWHIMTNEIWTKSRASDGDMIITGRHGASDTHLLTQVNTGIIFSRMN